jgi:hypothetical protein
MRSRGDASDWFFLAMARWHLGDRDKAREAYSLAVRWMQKHQPRDQQLHRFRAEAADLLGVTDRTD